MSHARLIRVDAQADRERRQVTLKVRVRDGEMLQLVDAPMSLEAAEALHRDLGEAIGRLRIPMVARKK